MKDVKQIISECQNGTVSELVQVLEAENTVRFLEVFGGSQLYIPRLNDYDRESASNRYGTAKELGNAVQSLTLMQDKSFTFTIDRGNLKIPCLQTVQETLYRGRLTKL